jgi:hypothetical protein
MVIACHAMMIGSMSMGSYGAEDTRARCHQLAWSILGSKMIYLKKWSAGGNLVERCTVEQ